MVLVTELFREFGYEFLGFIFVSALIFLYVDMEFVVNGKKVLLNINSLRRNLKWTGLFYKTHIYYFYSMYPYINGLMIMIQTKRQDMLF